MIPEIFYRHPPRPGQKRIRPDGRHFGPGPHGSPLPEPEKSSHVVHILLLLMVTMIIACTGNPFDQSKIRGNASSLSGQILLPEGAAPESVFVWLEGVRIFTFSGPGGEFQLRLPAASRLSMVPASGVFRLFFYIANYRIVCRKVAVRNGYFVYGNRDVGANGTLLEPVRLFRLLEIRTTVQPETVLVNYSGRIWVKTEFFALQDTVEVVFPRSDGALLGAVLLQNTTTGKTIPVLSAYSEETEYVVETTAEMQSLVRIFTLQSYPLPPGTYRVVPYLFIRQKDLPPELLADLLQLTSDRYRSYLHIPFRRQEAYLHVVGISASRQR